MSDLVGQIVRQAFNTDKLEKTLGEIIAMYGIFDVHRMMPFFWDFYMSGSTLSYSINVS